MESLTNVNRQLCFLTKLKFFMSSKMVYVENNNNCYFNIIITITVKSQNVDPRPLKSFQFDVDIRY